MIQAISRQLREQPRELWLNLERTKVVDVVGLAVVAQAVSRANARGTSCIIFPSSVVYRGLFRAGLLDQLPVGKQRSWERGTPEAVIEVDASASPPEAFASSPHLRLALPTWEELRLLEQWARDEVLAQMVGSELLRLCQDFGPYDPDVLAEAIASPRSLTLLIHPAAPSAVPVGFVRLYNIDLGQRFAFLETVIAATRGRRPAWGIEASRLLCGYAVDALGLHRIETKVYADNLLSINALRHHGFTLEGRLREAHVHEGRRSDILVFGVLEPEIRAELAGDGFPDMGLWRDEPA
jgi:RimJ/RimL family protein N-acetyltransferase